MEQPLPKIRKILFENQAEMLKILVSARKRVEERLAAMAVDRGFGVNQNEQYGKLVAEYEKMQKELDAWGKDVVERTQKDFFSSAKEATASNLSFGDFSRKYSKRYFEYISPENGPGLAAVHTQKMSQRDIDQLRSIVVDSFREASVSGMTARDRQKLIQNKVIDLAQNGTESWQFMDAAGKKWNNSNYFNMLNRTLTSTVARESYHDTLIDAGFDLARLQGGGSPCPVCDSYRDMIYSISGADKRFPSESDLKSAGVWHPNCVCYPEYVDEDIDKDEIGMQADTPNPDEPDRDAWNEYAKQVNDNRKEMASVKAVPDALKVA
jgi:hypothetical protein